METRRRASALRPAVLGFVLLPALYGGCQGLETPPSHGSCYEHDGMWCRNYMLSFEGARIAILAALHDLRMPECRNGRYRHGIFINTRTQDNLEVRIMILPEDHPGEGTRVCIRVGGFGMGTGHPKFRPAMGE